MVNNVFLSFCLTLGKTCARTGGYVNGQTVVLLLLVTQSATILVDFAFYMPDPVFMAWAKEDKRLKQQGATKKDRPVMPGRNKAYPTKAQLAVRLLQEFKDGPRRH